MTECDEETYRSAMIRVVPAMSGASYESIFVVEINATGREIWDRMIGLLSGLLVLAARPMYGAGVFSFLLRLVVKARASDILPVFMLSGRRTKSVAVMIL